jgi:hypothetical protein
VRGFRESFPQFFPQRSPTCERSIPSPGEWRCRCPSRFLRPGAWGSIWSALLCEQFSSQF